MTYAVTAMCIGTLAYLGMLVFQTPEARRDLDAWGDVLFVSTVLTVFLGILMFWGMFERLSHTTLASLIEGLFQPRTKSGLVKWRAFPGFVALPFTLLAGLHVLVLLALNKLGRGETSDTRPEQTREK